MKTVSLFKTFILIASVSFVSSLAMAAASKVKFGKAQFSGAGCPKGTAQFIPSPNGKSFSIIFDQYEVVSDKSVGHKYCDLVVPITVAKGFQLKLSSIDYRGFLDLGPDTAAQVGSYPMFVNSKSKAKKGSWQLFTHYGEMSDEFTETLSMAGMPGSFCGDTKTQYMVLYNLVSIYNYSPTAGELSTAILDSMDGTSTVKGKYTVSSCP